MFSVAGPGLDPTFTLFGEERGRESFSSFTAALFFCKRQALGDCHTWISVFRSELLV